MVRKVGGFSVCISTTFSSSDIFCTREEKFDTKENKKANWLLSFLIGLTSQTITCQPRNAHLMSLNKQNAQNGTL